MEIGDDIIDSRDIIARIDALEGVEELDESEVEELAFLKAFAAEAEGYIPDWHYGETLIRDGYFAKYAQEFADDCGFIDRNATWPLNHIDWDAAADELQSDYTCFEVDGYTYWGR